MCLLAKVSLVGVLLRKVLLVAGEKVSEVSELLEKKENIPPESVTMEEERVLQFSGALPGFCYSWSFSSLVGWTGGIGSYTSGFCRCASLLIQQWKFVSTSITDIRMDSVWVKEFEKLP